MVEEDGGVQPGPAAAANQGEANKPAPGGLFRNAANQAPVKQEVLPADTKDVNAPLRPREGAPRITLSNFQAVPPAEGSLEAAMISFDFDRQGEIPKDAKFTIYAKSKENKTTLTTFLGSPFEKNTHGTIRVKDSSFNAGFPVQNRPTLATIPITIWVEMTELWCMNYITQQVSNSISINGESPHNPREWTVREKKIHERHLKWQTPLPPPPEGYTVVDNKTRLVPGLPIMEASSHEWLPSEVLDDQGSSQVLVNTMDLNDELTLNFRYRIAVKDSDLRESLANPGKFKPSVRVLPGGRAKIPNDYVLVDQDTKLFPGTSVEIQRGSGWTTMVIAEIPDPQHVKLHDAFFTAEDHYPRTSLLLKPETIELLKQPDIESRLALRLKRLRKGTTDYVFKRETYDHLKDLPPGISRLPDDLPLSAGMKLTIKNSTKWEDVEFVEMAWDGGCIIRTLDIFKHEGPIDRDLLAISAYELAKATGGDALPGKPGDTSPDKPETSPDTPLKEESDQVAKSSGLSGHLVPVLPSMNLMPGVPIRTDDPFGRPKDATISTTVDSDHVEVVWEGRVNHRGDKIHRSKLLIDENVAALLDRPEYQERFANNLKRVRKLGGYNQYTEAEVSIRLPIPPNAVPVTDKTPLCEGAKLGINNGDKWGKYRWWDVTVLAVNWDDTLLIHIDGESDFKDGEVQRDCLIISKTELKRLEAIATSGGADGESSKVSKEEVENLLSVDGDTKLLPGVPILIEHDGSWKKATVIREFIGKVIALRDDLAGTSKIEEVPLNRIKIQPQVLEALKLPENEERFASRAERMKKGEIGQDYPTEMYAVRDPIPNGAVRVTDRTPLQIGTNLGLFRQGKWVDVTVIDLNWDGSVRIHINKENDRYDGDIDRSCLIIARNVIRQLLDQQKANETSKKE